MYINQSYVYKIYTLSDIMNNADDEIINDLMNDDNYIIDNTIPNYAIDNVPDNIIKTEIHICPKCMYPDIIGTEPFNRRKIEARQIRLDDIVHSSFKHFCSVNKLSQNAGLALLLRIAYNPEVYKMLMGSFTGISKRKGRNNRSKEFLLSS